MVRVVLIDDHDIFRAGLVRLLEDAGDIEVIAETPNGLQGVWLVISKQPDVAIIDIKMAGIDGLEVACRIHDAVPKVGTIMLTQDDEEVYVSRSLETGAKGCLSKSAAPRQLVAAVRKVFQGGCHLPDKHAQHIDR